MKNLRKILPIFMAVMLTLISFLGTPAISFAEKSTPTDNDVKIVKRHDINDIIKNPEKYPNIEIGGPYTKEEFANIMAADENITIEKAMDVLTDENDYASTNAINTIGYLTFRETIVVKDYIYKVQVRFYCKMDFYGGGPEPTDFISVNKVTLDRGYYGGPKEFSGEIYYNLETNTSLYYEIEGDFWDYGTTTYTGGGEIKVGAWGNVKFDISYASDHFQYLSPKQGYFDIW